MLRFKIIRAILVFLILLTIAVVVFFFLDEEEMVETKQPDYFKNPNRSLIMKGPSIEWGEHQLTAEELEVIKDKDNPRREKQIYKDFTFRKKDGDSTIELTGKSASVETLGAIETFAQIIMKGAVKCQLSNGWFISSSSLTYDQSGLLSSESSISFGSANATGTADMFQYNSSIGKMQIAGNINLAIDSYTDDGQPDIPIIITAQSIEYDTNTGEFFILGGFNAEKKDEFLSGNSVQGLISPATRKIIAMDVLENARMCFKNLSGTAAEPEKSNKDKKSPFNFDGLKLITSPVIKFEFWEDTGNNIKSITTTKPSSLFIYENNIREKEKIRIAANEFDILSSEENAFLEKMTANGKVRITQLITTVQPNSKRVISCESFNGMFDKSGVFTSIDLMGGLNITETNYTINSDSGVYKSKDTRLTFNGSPIVEHKDGVSAAEIVKFDTGRSVLHFEKNVVSKIRRTGGTDKLFTGHEDIFINASAMIFNSETNSSVYKGNVKAYQGKSQVFTESLALNQDVKTLILQGKANGRIFENRESKDDKTVNAGKQTRNASQKDTLPVSEAEQYIEFSCDKATINENKNYLILEKKAHVFRSSGEDIKGEKIKYIFKDKITQPIQTEATGNAIYKKNPYESNSEYLFYDIEKDLITLKGGKVILYSEGKPLIAARELTFKSAGDIINIKGLPGERIEAVWRTEDKKKSTREEKKKK